MQNDLSGIQTAMVENMLTAMSAGLTIACIWIVAWVIWTAAIKNK